VIDPERQRLLLVEDNPDDEALTLRTLRRHGVTNEVVVARDGAEALDYLFGTGTHAGRDAHNIPRVVLLDLQLPKVSGLEVLRRVRADPRTHLVPVVVFTSSTEEQDLLQAYGSRANSYIQKPIDSVQFDEVLRWLGHYWLTLNQAPPRSTQPPRRRRSATGP
jgi:two-component system response regulator